MRRAAILLAFALATTCSASACSSEPTPLKGANVSGAPASSQGAPSATTSKPMTSTGPFDIRLRADRGPVLVAELHNTSTGALSVVKDGLLQPSELVLTGPGGAVTPFDTREQQKYDNTVRETSFTTVAAGGTAPVETAKVAGKGGSAALQWGPYRFESLPSGSYRAKVVFKSAITEYLDASNKPTKKSDAWVGTVTSNEVTFQVP